MTLLQKEKDHFPSASIFRFELFRFGEGVSAGVLFFLSELFSLFLRGEKLIFAHIDRFLTVLYQWILEPRFFRRVFRALPMELIQKKQWVQTIFCGQTQKYTPPKKMQGTSQKWSKTHVFLYLQFAYPKLVVTHLLHQSLPSVETNSMLEDATSYWGQSGSLEAAFLQSVKVYYTSRSWKTILSFLGRQTNSGARRNKIRECKQSDSTATLQRSFQQHFQGISRSYLNARSCNYREPMIFMRCQ